MSNNADVAVSLYFCDITKNYYVSCQPGISFSPFYFWTRYPLEKSKIFNILNLFSPESWIGTFLSITAMVISLKIATYIGVKLGLDTATEEIILFPLRCKK